MRKLECKSFGSNNELVEFVNTNNITNSKILGVISDEHGVITLFFYKETRAEI